MRPDDDADAGVQALVGVRERLVGDGEVDDDVGVVEHVAELGAQRRVGPAGELEPSAASTASQTVAPIRPAAPGDRDSDRHAAISSDVKAGADRRHGLAEAALVGADAGRGDVLGRVELGGERGDVVDRDRVDLGDDLVDAEQRQVEEDGVRRSGSSAPRSTRGRARSGP